MSGQTLIGIDVGTTAIKAILIGTDGHRIDAFSRPVEMHRPAPGLAEQDANAWSEGVLAALAAFAAAHDLRGLAGIGICSQVNTHVFVAASGQPLLPAITWQDTRCAPDAAALEGKVTAEQKAAWFGAPIPIDASHALSRIAHVRRVAPETYASTRHVLLPKDFCIMQLTGAVGSDAISAVGLVGQNGYVDELIDLVPNAKALLPPLSKFHQVAGTVRNGLPCAGVPVVTGTMDAWGGMFGIGVIEDGDAMYQSGTSEILGIVSSKVHPTPGVIVFPPYEGIVMHAAPTQSGGAALSWLAGVLGSSPASLLGLAEAASPSDAVPHFLPHLQGERAPLWDSSSRGVFARIDARAGAPEMIRSVLEGVALSARLAFAALQSSAGITVEAAKLGGGGARSDLWNQIRADALGFPLHRAAISDSAAVGAAILAGLGSGLMGSLRDAVHHLVRFDRTIEPDPQHRAYYDDKFGHYTALYDTMRPFNDRFSGGR